MAALKDLFTGANCAPESNAMRSMLAQFERGKGIQGEASRFVPQQPVQQRLGPGNVHLHQDRELQREFESQFLQAGGSGSGAHGMRQHDLAIAQRQLERARIEDGPRMAGADWANEYMMQRGTGMGMPHHHLHNPHHADFEEAYRQASASAAPDQWHQEFLRSQQPTNLPLVEDAQTALFEKAFADVQEKADGDWSAQFISSTDSKGKGVADNWVDEFEGQNAAELLAQTAGHVVDSVENSNEKFKNSKFISLMRQLRDQNVVVEGNVLKQRDGITPEEFLAQSQSQNFDDQDPLDMNFQSIPNFENAWKMSASSNTWKEEFMRNMSPGAHSSDQSATAGDWSSQFRGLHPLDQEETVAGPQNAPSQLRSSEIGGETDWASEFSKQAGQSRQVIDEAISLAKHREDWVEMYKEKVAHLKIDDGWEDMQKDWERLNTTPFGYDNFADSHAPYQRYEFASANPFLNRDSAPRLLQEAQSLLKSNHLTAAVLSLEACVQLDPSNAAAWQLLGKTQSENENDEAAIPAFRRALALDPKQSDAWIGLATSYINENCRPDAFRALGNWLLNNPTYSHLIDAADVQPQRPVDPDMLIAKLLQAARMLAGGKPDADIQCALAMLFYVKGDAGKSIDCLTAALQTRPDDHVLWNKLGAILANNDRNEEAVNAYSKALEILPGYIRAQYNLALSCIKLGAHKEAIEHLLGALHMQKIDYDRSSSLDETHRPSALSNTIWDTLRLAFFMVHRDDLATRCDKRDMSLLEGGGNSEFDF